MSNPEGEEMIGVGDLKNEIIKNRMAIENHSGKVDRNNIQIDLLTKTMIALLQELSRLRSDVNFLSEIIGKR